MQIRAHLTDKKAAEDGKWFEYDGARFLICAHGTPGFQKVARKIGKKNLAAIQREDVIALNGMSVEVMAKAVLKDWEGVKDGEKEFPYSEANALHLLTVAGDFRNWVEAQSMNLSNFIAEEEGADVAALKSGGPVGAPVG